MNPETTGDWLVAAELEPSVEGSLAPLYEAAAEHRLAMPFCDHFGHALELEQLVCAACGGLPVWRDVVPEGTVHSATMVFRRERSLIRTDLPYVVLDVELDSGHRVVMTTEEPTSAVPAIGERVIIGFRAVGRVHVPAARLHSDTYHPTEEVTP